MASCMMETEIENSLVSFICKTFFRVSMFIHGKHLDILTSINYEFPDVNLLLGNLGTYSKYK